MVPVYREQLLDTERLSLEQLAAKLGERDIHLVAPDGLDVAPYLALLGRRPVHSFSPAFFASRDTYNELLVHEPLWRLFEAYEFVLVHQTDAFVIEDQLDDWVERGWDFIGSPFWADWGASKHLGMIGVGNGGFSLRRVEPALRALSRARRPAARLLQHVPRTRLRALWRTRHGSLTEDRYWTEFGVLENVAPVDEAVRFAFDMGLEYLADVYATVTPFGCHYPWNLDYVLRHRRGERRGDEPEYERVIFELMLRTGNLGPVSVQARDAGLLP